MREIKFGSGRIRTARLFGALILLVSCSMLAMAQQPLPTAAKDHGAFPRVSPDGAHILFSCTTGEHRQVFVMNSDGTDQHALTAGPEDAHSAQWSFDGRRIVYEVRISRDVSKIYVMDADGKNNSLISEGKGDHVPAFSPDGTKVVVASGTFPHINIFEMNADGSGRVNLSPNDDGFDSYPVFSPDGGKIAFSHATRETGSRVWVMNADGTNRRRLTNAEINEEVPAWSADGKKVAFQSSKRGEHEAYIDIANASDGSTQVIGTHSQPYLDEIPSLFPDGKHVAFQSNRSGVMEIWTLNLDGSELKQLTGQTAIATTPVRQDENRSGYPAVSPDGKHIAFVGVRHGLEGIYITRPDGTHESLVFKSPEVSSPSWTQDGKHVLFSTFANGVSHLSVIDLDGGNQHDVASVPGRSPALSPNGRRLVYMAGTWMKTELMLSDADGSNARMINDGQSVAWNHHWSPDGERLAFTGDDESGHHAVFVMKADGTDRHQVTHVPLDEGAAQWPVWSYDGRKLAVQVNGKDHKSHIWVVDASTGDAQKLATHSEAYLDETPSWFPDGKHIAFQSNRTGRMEVWIMKSDGTDLKQITKSEP